MPLIDLKTDLKSLKYGKDQPGGGDSGQPYITTNVDGIHGTQVNFPNNSILGLFGLGLNSLPLLPNASSLLNRSSIGRFVNDFLSGDEFIRGGALGAAQASINDAFRIGSFFLSLPKGPLFIAKQVGLQLSNPLLEVKKGGRGLANGALNFSPGSLLGTVTGGILGPTRIYNLGINTIAQVPVNAFGVHFSRHGLLPVQDNSNNYESVVTFNNESNGSKENRLVELTNKFSLGQATSFSKQSAFTTAINQISGFLTGTIGLPNITKWKPTNNLIQKPTPGGPSSVYGIGFTSILRTQYTGDAFKNNAVYLSNEATLKLSQSNLNYYNTLGVSRTYFSTDQEINDFTQVDSNNPNKKPQSLDDFTYDTLAKGGDYIDTINGKLSNPNPTVIKTNKKTYAVYKRLVEDKILTDNKYKDLGSKPALLNDIDFFNRNSDDKIDVDFPITYRNVVVGDNVGYRNGYEETVIISAPKGWLGLSREVRVGSGRQDLINLTPIFSDNGGSAADSVKKLNIPGNPTSNINDLVKFRIQAVDGKNPKESDWMIFRAYLTQLSDNVDANWNSVKYAGRGEDFYIYGGFGRKVQIGFKVASLSVEEMEPMYQKLNYLMSNLMPDYNGTLMRGPMIRMTVGNWIDGQFGILNSLSYSVPQDSPWEIGLGDKYLILPHVLEVSMTFTPIGSQTQAINKISSKSQNTSNIAQNYNGAAKGEPNYIKP
jgi:hypothetical protein